MSDWASRTHEQHFSHRPQVSQSSLRLLPDEQPGHQTQEPLGSHGQHEKHLKHV